MFFFLCMKSLEDYINVLVLKVFFLFLLTCEERQAFLDISTFLQYQVFLESKE